MNIQKLALESFQELTVEKQKVALDFIKFLQYQQAHQPLSPKSLRGLWADLDFSVTEDDISTARQEMWGNFPRELDL